MMLLQAPGATPVETAEHERRSRALRVVCLMEQHLGHRTYSENMRLGLAAAGGVGVSWAPIGYAPGDALWERLPLPAYLRGSLRGRREVRRALRGSPADVMLFNTQVPAVLGGGLTRRRPYLVATDITPRQYDRLAAQYGHRADRFAPLAAYKHAVNRRVFQQAARLLPWSSWAARSLIEEYGAAPERVSVVAPGVDLQRWRPAARRAGPARVLFVGGDYQRKGGERLMRAFAALPPGSAELTLITKTHVAGREGVRVLNHLRPNDPELIAEFQRSDVFVLPSDGEAFGIAAVEASATGLAVIATAMGGLADIVADGDSGFLVPPGDEGALAGRLAALVGDGELRARMGRAARARAMAFFDARQNAARVAGYLREAAEHARGAHAD